MQAEQLDMFYASAMESERKVTEQDLQNAHDKKYQEPKKLTPRQWALLHLVKINSQNGEKTTQRQIYDYCNGYEWNDDDTCHDHCPAIWNDIKDINLSYETDKLIISKNFEYWLGNEQETLDFISRLWNDLEPRLMRYWAYLKKVNRDGQMTLVDRKGNVITENSKARRFIESYLGEHYEIH